METATTVMSSASRPALKHDRSQGVDVALLGQHRRRPASFKLGRRRVWRKSHVLAWIAAQQAATGTGVLPDAEL